jgi:chemotaxis protein histidine kinase CheA
MAIDVFAERLAKVRHRFMSTLASKIEDTYTALPCLSGDGPDAAEGVAEVYRRIHNIVGVGPSVGFTATGSTARKVESILFLAQHARRGLNSNELTALKPMLHILRDTAQQELQSTLSGWRAS